MVNRGCTFEMPDGQLCRASAIRGERFCYMHDPERVEEAAESRRLGGIRRRRERTVAGAYELAGVRTIDDLFRVVEIATFDLLSLENGIARNGALLRGVLVGAKLLEVGEQEDRIAALELAIKNGHRGPASDGGLLAG
jgi:hypothetical protein